VNIKSPKFGATGNGSHDDTAAFQAAIDYAFAHNLTAVYCPAGNSITSNTIYLDPPGSMRPFTFKGYISNGSGSGSAGNNLTVTRAPYGGILQGSNGGDNGTTLSEPSSLASGTYISSDNGTSWTVSASQSVGSPGSPGTFAGSNYRNPPSSGNLPCRSLVIRWAARRCPG
jgi:hypothetical protein